MDTFSFLIGGSVLILVSYLFEFVGKKIRFPSVVLLVFAGIGLRALADRYQFSIPYLQETLPVFGTIGLIFIVLEGALDLEVSREKMNFIGRSFLLALVSVLLTAFAIAFGLHWQTGVGWHIAVVNALPFAVVSSAVAIPAAQSLGVWQREAVTYESSFSDIIGVLLFNGALSATVVNIETAGHFIGNIVTMVGLSIILAVALTIYIDKVEHHVKFLPLLALLVLVYSLAKKIHLSPLILILIYGLLLNNLELLPRVAIFKTLNYDKLNDELAQFKHIIVELVFFIRTLFFVVFGFTVQAANLINLNYLLYAVVIFIAIVVIRLLALLLTARKWLKPLLYFSPRGLITILLFLSVPEAYKIDALPNEIVVSVVLLTLLFLSFGNIIFEKMNIRLNDNDYEDRIAK